MSVTALQRLRYGTFMRYPIKLQHCGEKLLLLIVIALDIWKSLSLLRVIAVAHRKRYRFYSYRSESMTKEITCYNITF